MPVSFDKAYVLHQRRYTDSRIIVEFLTFQQGVVHAVARAPGKRDRAKFENFQPVSVEFIGVSELKTLRYCEQMADSVAPLSGTGLFCGIYLNELLQRVLSPAEPFPELFHFYETTLQRLRVGSSQMDYESALRKMEFFLLSELGFALDFFSCCITGNPVSTSGSYRYVVGEGFFEVPEEAMAKGKFIALPGAHLLAIGEGQLNDPTVLKTAKLISRKALSPLLEGKPLKSRELFS